MEVYLHLLLALSATSATLLGVCVAIMCFIDSALISPNIEELKIGEMDYKSALEARGKFAIIAGILFFIDMMLCLAFSYHNLSNVWLPILIFIIGCIFLVSGLISGRIKFKYIFPEWKKPPEIK